MNLPQKTPDYMPPKPDKEEKPAKQKKRWNWKLAIGLSLWVLASFVAAQVLVVGLVLLFRAVGAPLEAFSGPVLQAVIAAVVYTLSLVITIGVPWLVKRRLASRRDVGLQRLPSWMDILLAPAGFVVYLIVTAGLTLLSTQLIPGFDVAQPQEIGFEDLGPRYEYLLAFATLVVIAPIAEEVLFRGYLYGKVRKHVPVWLAMLIVSILFGAVHGQLNVAVDTFALSMVMCSLREVTGSIWTGVLLHMMKNGLAFYLLFINPTLIDTIGRL